MVAAVYTPYGDGAQIFGWLNGSVPVPDEALFEGVTKCGKTRMVAEWFKAFASMYPRSKSLVLRKTKTSLVDAWQDIFENQVLGPGHPALRTGGQGEDRRRYKHPSLGGEIVLGGMGSGDQTRKLFSTNYDAVYVNECQELTKEEWESLIRATFGRPRGEGYPPFRILFGDCNPEDEYHWANQRCIQGRMHRIVGRFWDNPRLYNHEEGRWTEEGVEFLRIARRSMTGARLQRLFYGRWVSSEGQVWEGWDPQVHMLTGAVVKEADGHFLYIYDAGWAQADGTPARVHLQHFIGTQDCGYPSPGVGQVWGFDEQWRAYMVAEVYRTKDHEWWAERWAELAEEFPLHACFIDHDHAWAHTFNTKVRRKGYDGAPLFRFTDKVRKGSPGQKEKAGIDQIRVMMRPKVDGSRGLYLLRDCLRFGREQRLIDESRPWATHQEFSGYCYPVREDGKPIKDEPIKVNDHGCDAMRMMGVYWRDHVGFEQSAELERRPDPSWGPRSYGVRLRHAEVLGNTARRIYRGKAWRNGRLVDAPPTPGQSMWRNL